MTAKTRILRAEDQAMVRGALTALLNLEEDLEVVVELSQGVQVLQLAKKTGYRLVEYGNVWQGRTERGTPCKREGVTGVSVCSSNYL